MFCVFCFLLCVATTISFGRDVFNGEMIALPFFLILLYAWYFLFRCIYSDITGKPFEYCSDETIEKMGNISDFIWKFFWWVILPAYGIISFALR